MPNPIYNYDQLKPAYKLQYTWTGWPTSGTRFPPLPESTFFKNLDAAWQSDNLTRIATNWHADKIQFTFSATPIFSPTLFV